MGLLRAFVIKLCVYSTLTKHTHQALSAFQKLLEKLGMDLRPLPREAEILGRK